VTRLGEYFERHQLGFAWWALFGVTATMGIWSSAEASNPGQVDVQFAATPYQMAVIFSRLAQKGGFDGLRQAITIDTWLLIPLYVAFLMVTVQWVRIHFPPGSLMRQVGQAFMLIAIIAGILDLIENHQITSLISDDTLLTAGPAAISAGAVHTITGLALSKFVALAFIGLYLLICGAIFGSRAGARVWRDRMVGPVPMGHPGFDEEPGVIPGVHPSPDDR
jgi:hypothetical protein